ncbi:hypothetical protein [Stieleria varia]|uniref:Uncharacterized protein n=1 Tax=Stieleria varia TaxID=2528005 RepID=A0A5C6B9H4_9BACT|nr:hypothetical protein [Stieleria varia]TWU08292.1 hypothetical protein Pla52n_08740 [Stieleria varia]
MKSGDYHGWDAEGDNWRFANVIGHPQGERVFLIEDFGRDTTPREALSAIMSATAQFQGRVQVVCTETNRRLIEKLKAASLLKVAPMTVGGQEQWGILGVRSKSPPKKTSWWKFW